MSEMPETHQGSCLPHNGMPPLPSTCSQFNRRTFLAAATSSSLSYLLAGCSGQNLYTLRVRSLNGSVPAQLVGEFRNQMKRASKEPVLQFSPELQLQTIFAQLQTWKQNNAKVEPSLSGWFDWVPFVGDRGKSDVADLVMIGNYWLPKAIQQKLIQPLDLSKLKGWAQLLHNDRWKALVMRDDQGQVGSGSVWGAPYRWGSTVIAYRQDIFKSRGLEPPTDWQDLWRPEFQGQISLPDQAREVIGLTLKKLGKSYNTADLKTVPTLEAELRALQQQVKFYSADAYLQPLLLGDTWLAVGSSAEILPLIQRTGQIAAVVPKSGTALWAELWVRPVGVGDTPSLVANAWIDFCWQSNIASQLSLLSQATSPAVLAIAREKLPKDLQRNPILLPDATILQKSEFLEPLPQDATSQYQEVWQHLRQMG